MAKACIACCTHCPGSVGWGSSHLVWAERDSVLALCCQGGLMATITVRNVAPETVESLKEIAGSKGLSMEQQVRNLLEEYVGDRAVLLREIEAARANQARRPTADEIEEWIEAGRR